MKFRVICYVDERTLGPLVELMAPYGQVTVAARPDDHDAPPASFRDCTNSA